jgi:cytochrome c553
MRLGVMLPVGSALGFEIPAAERIDHNARRLASIAPSATIEYGKYLSAVCTECHQAENIGKAVNDWSQGDFIHAFQTGTRSNGEQISSAMRTKTFSELNETELSALWLYFRSLQPAESQK